MPLGMHDLEDAVHEALKGKLGFIDGLDYNPATGVYTTKEGKIFRVDISNLTPFPDDPPHPLRKG